MPRAAAQNMQDQIQAGPPCIRCWSPTQPLTVEPERSLPSRVRLFQCAACGFVTGHKIKQKPLPHVAGGPTIRLS
jgi:hypothetical protein